MKNNMLKFIAIKVGLFGFSSYTLADVQVRLKSGNNFVVEKVINGEQKFAVKIDGGQVFPHYAVKEYLTKEVEVGECYRNTTESIVFCVTEAGSNGVNAT